MVAPLRQRNNVIALHEKKKSTRGRRSRFGPKEQIATEASDSFPGLELLIRESNGAEGSACRVNTGSHAPKIRSIISCFWRSSPAARRHERPCTPTADTSSLPAGDN
jgi:hypothetical protein